VVTDGGVLLDSLKPLPVELGQMGVNIAGSMELGNVCMQLEKSGIAAGVLAFKEVPYVFGLATAMWAEVTVACRSSVLCALEGASHG